jgi:hypothetical protein
MQDRHSQGPERQRMSVFDMKINIWRVRISVHDNRRTQAFSQRLGTRKVIGVGMAVDYVAQPEPMLPKLAMRSSAGSMIAAAQLSSHPTM